MTRPMLRQGKAWLCSRIIPAGLLVGFGICVQAQQMDASLPNVAAEVHTSPAARPIMAALPVSASSSMSSPSAASTIAAGETNAGSGPEVAGYERAALPQADRVLVNKGDRKLYLLRNGDILRAYRISLGLRPEGHKQFEGDFRTPEGVYRLTRRNPNSEYFLSIQVDYPNAQDRARAQRQGLRPGGAIMIHGEPNAPRKPRDYYANVDWTEGCIAVSNSDMVEIWLMTPPGTPIEIRP